MDISSENMDISSEKMYTSGENIDTSSETWTHHVRNGHFQMFSFGVRLAWEVPVETPL